MRRWALPFVIVCFCFIAACSEPPTKEFKQATDAIAMAESAGAANYAAAELAAAQTALARYDGFVAQRDFRQALNAAIEARDKAYEAAKLASAELVVLRIRANELLRDLDGRIKASGGAGARSKDSQKAGKTMQEARTKLDAGDVRGAIKLLSAAIAEWDRGVAASSGGAKKGRR